jgi:hypothetical protein
LGFGSLLGGLFLGFLCRSFSLKPCSLSGFGKGLVFVDL